MRFAHDPDTKERIEVVDLGLVWDVGAPSPHLVQSEHRAFLAFYLSNPDPAWDGSWVRVVDPASDEAEPIGVIEWLQCGGAVLGGLNDEALHGHSLWSKGLDRLRYEAAEIVGSLWIDEWERANSVHPYHSPEKFAVLSHYLLAFHDSTFECLARGYISYRTNQSMPTVLAVLVRHVVGRQPLPFERVSGAIKTQ